MKINIENTAKLEAAIRAAEGKAYARTITAQDVQAACRTAFAHFGITKKALNHCKISVDLNAQSFPNAYRGIPESTIFDAIFSNGKWYITDIRRGRTRSPRNRFWAELTEAAQQEIIYTRTVFEGF